MTSTAPVPPWPLATLREVAGVLAETENGLTGREIGDLLERLRISDPMPMASKRARLTEAFIARQNADQSAKRLVTFITEAMQPVTYRDRPDLFTLRRDRLNERLAFVGLHVTDAGKVAHGAVATTLSEAARIATSLRDELVRRKTHPKVLDYASVEVLTKANLHAVLEATKSMYDRLRSMSGLSGDGAALVEAALAVGKAGTPPVKINTLSTQTERDEQTGLASLIKGLGGLYRNPSAHEPRLTRKVTDDELLEAMTAVSMIHRRLDSAVVTRPA